MKGDSKMNTTPPSHERYHITKADLEYLSARVAELQQLTKDICLEEN